ncbi:hypothetical protein TNCV_3762721 [Trichonephila clavipes]|nr:hypothetical protein TNCV_3762721 [Trichonephila clavipes]
MLSRALRGHHVLHPHQAQDTLLWLQPHHPLRSHLIYGTSRIHIAAGLRREAHSRICSDHLNQHQNIDPKNRILQVRLEPRFRRHQTSLYCQKQPYQMFLKVGIITQSPPLEDVTVVRAQFSNIVISVFPEEMYGGVCVCVCVWEQGISLYCISTDTNHQPNLFETEFSLKHAQLITEYRNAQSGVCEKPLISARSAKIHLQWCREKRNWTFEDWKREMWSDESRYPLFCIEETRQI